MSYLARGLETRLDPRRAFPWARAMIALAYPYRPPPQPLAHDWRSTLRGRIAAYALGPDYHETVLALLRTLAARLGSAFPRGRFRPYVDTGPIVERQWAMRAGVGWIGKNTLVLHRAAGSYFFLAELLTDLDTERVALPQDHCGSCMRCVRACPTGALENGYTMDPRRCLSYLTIEHRGAIPAALRPALENWIFGCDLCQEVCPWNPGRDDADAAERLTPHLPTVLALDAAGFRARFGTTAVTRAKRRGLLRNAAVALRNSGNPDAAPALAHALADPEPLVRGHAASALRHLGGLSARPAVEAAYRPWPDPRVAAGTAAALGWA